MIRLRTISISDLPEFLLIGLLLAVTACEGQEEETPVPPPLTQETPVDPAPPAEDDLQRLKKWAERLSIAREVSVYGRLDAEDLAYVIGEVAAVSTDVNGNILILDEKYHELKVFDPDGRHLHTVGGAGRGPGEFLQPNTLDWLAADTLVITDGTRRGQLFERTPDGFLAFIRTFPTQVAVEGSCARDGDLWVHGMGPEMDRRVFRIDIEAGQLSESLAPVVPEEHPILRRRRALGFMACSSDLGLVVVTSRYFPDVQAFGFDGAARWTSGIQGFTPMEFTIVDGGGLRQGIAKDAGGFHWIVGAVFLDRSTIAVQVGWQTIESSEAGLDYTEIVTHLFSGHNGVSLKVGTGIPLIHEPVPGGFLASADDPFPRVLRYEYSEPGK